MPSTGEATPWVPPVSSSQKGGAPAGIPPGHRLASFAGILPPRQSGTSRSHYPGPREERRGLRSASCLGSGEQIRPGAAECEVLIEGRTDDLGEFMRISRGDGAESEDVPEQENPDDLTADELEP